MEPLARLIGDSAGIAAVRERIRRLLERQSELRRIPPVLIQGETGTGKGLLARIIHDAGPRASGPFVDVNCTAIPETLLEAEMFGFERGAFTDAHQAKAGLFQAAHRGTIFLDEVGLLPESLQTKLLKVIEERALRRLGSTRTEPVDVAILAATSEDLAAALRARRFREDLYHRLAVVTVSLPALRDRGPDIERLAEHFLARACADYGLAPKTLSPEARAALLAYAWPGNLRELANVMERVALLSDAPTVTPPMLGLPEAPPAGAGARRPREAGGSLPETVRAVEQEHLLEALRATGWNISHAALRLGISRNRLRYRMEKHRLRPGLAPDESRGAPEPPAAPRPAAPEPAAPLPEPPLPDTARLSAERRPLTWLRAALAVSATRSPSEAGRALDTFVEKVESFGGRVEELSPIRIDATFGVDPVEDAPIRTAHAAMAIQKAAERALGADALPLAVRIGIHAGQFVIEQVGGATEIDPTARAAAGRALEALLDRAEPGSVLVSEAASALLARRFDLVPIQGPDPAAARAYRLVGRERTGPAPTRRLATFVGRRQEIELLQSRLASTTMGLGQVVGIAGEAGIGKTRLLFEFRQGLAGRRVTYLEGYCVAYGHAIPYLPLLDLLRNHCGIGEADTPETIIDKVRGGLAQVGMDPEEGTPYLLQLLGVKEGTGPHALLSPEAIKARTFETLRRMALNGSRKRPLVLAVENLHWIDKTSEEYLASLVESLAGAPILLLLTYRPGFRPSWIEKSYVTQVALQPLAPPDSLSLVRSFLQMPELADPVAQRIVATAEGNPFFLEELALAVTEPEDPDAVPAVPDTIQEALMARIDRLPDEPRRVLQTAAVLGREFSLRLLGAVWQRAGGLNPHLVELRRLEFLYEQAGAEEPVYVFKHALTQEVAYESLPPARRRALHAEAGRTLETLYADRLAEAYERLAYHYARTEVSHKAIEYLTRAADKAARTYAHAEAVRALEEAARHVERLGPEEQDRARLDLVLRQAQSLYFLGRFPESLDLLLRQRDRVEQLQDPQLTGPYYFWLGYTQSHLGDHAEADRSAGRAIEEARRGPDHATLGKAHYVLARGGFWSGRFLEGVEHGRQAVALLEQTEERWWLGAAHWGIAFNYGFMGEFASALEAAARAHAIGETIGDPRLQSYAAWTTGWLHAGMGEWEAAIGACRASLERSPDPVNTADAMSFLGAAYVGKGDPAQAIPPLTQAIAQWRRFRHRPMLGWFTAVLAEAYRLDGRLDEARTLATQGLTLTTEAGFRFGMGLAQRALGRVAQAAGTLDAAERHLGEALETFSAIQARAEAAATRLDLATVAHARGDRDAVASHLAEAYLVFRSLGVPKYEARATELARQFALPLPGPAPEPGVAGRPAASPRPIG